MLITGSLAECRGGGQGIATSWWMDEMNRKGQISGIRDKREEDLNEIRHAFEQALGQSNEEDLVGTLRPLVRLAMEEILK